MAILVILQSKKTVTGFEHAKETVTGFEYAIYFAH